MNQFTGVCGGWVRFRQAFFAEGGSVFDKHYHTDPVAETVDSYDADGRMIEQIQISSGDGGSGRAYLITTYTYNDANELTSETDNGVTQSYSYDAAGELLGDALVTYAYDPNGNRAELVRMSSSSGSGSGNNEVVNDGTWTYTYDIRGDLIGKNDGAGDIWTYTYDVGNRLVGRKRLSPTAARRKSVIRTMCSTT